MNRKLAALLAATTIVLLLVLPAAPASAHIDEQFEPWRFSSPVGGNPSALCGYKHNNFVRSVQVILFARGLLTSSQIDTYWGPTTYAAVKSWQTAHNLSSVDGCVGYFTWEAMENGHDNVTVHGTSYPYPHMIDLGFDSTTRREQWSYNEYNGSTTPIRPVFYEEYTNLCWYVRNNIYYIVADTLAADPGCAFD